MHVVVASAAARCAACAVRWSGCQQWTACATVLVSTEVCVCLQELCTCHCWDGSQHVCASQQTQLERSSTVRLMAAHNQHSSLHTCLHPPAPSSNSSSCCRRRGTLLLQCACRQQALQRARLALAWGARPRPRWQQQRAVERTSLQSSTCCVRQYMLYAICVKSDQNPTVCVCLCV